MMFIIKKIIREKNSKYQRQRYKNQTNKRGNFSKYSEQNVFKKQK